MYDQVSNENYPPPPPPPTEVLGQSSELEANDLLITSKTLLTLKMHSFFSLVPLEIDARGEKAQLAYQSALKDGAVNVYRGRVLLIGQDRAGKTSLKKSLIGLPFNRKEKSTDGIEVDPSKFQLDVDEVKNWQPIDDRKQGFLGCSKDVAQVMVEKMFDIPVSRDSVQGEERGEAIVQNDDNKKRKQVGADGEKEEVSLVNQVCLLSLKCDIFS